MLGIVWGTDWEDWVPLGIIGFIALLMFKDLSVSLCKWIIKFIKSQNQEEV